VWIDGAEVYQSGMPHWSDFEVGQDVLPGLAPTPTTGPKPQVSPLLPIGGGR
jgi:hypothetical protein